MIGLNPLNIQENHLNDPRVIDLIKEHMVLMEKYSPPSAQNHLDLEDYKDPKLSVWTAWEEKELLGIGALKELSPTHGELKSIKTHSDHLRKGVAQRLVSYIIKKAVQRGYTRISLETGSQEEYKPAIQFYKSIGFKPCEPFADHENDPASYFMTQEI